MPYWGLVLQNQNIFPVEKKNPVAQSETALRSKPICTNGFGQEIYFQAALLSTKMQMYTQSLTMFVVVKTLCYRMFQLVCFLCFNWHFRIFFLHQLSIWCYIKDKNQTCHVYIVNLLEGCKNLISCTLASILSYLLHPLNLKPGWIQSSCHK